MDVVTLEGVLQEAFPIELLECGSDIGIPTQHRLYHRYPLRMSYLIILPKYKPLLHKNAEI